MTAASLKGYAWLLGSGHAVVRLVRPLNVVLFMAGVGVGGLLTAGIDVLREPLVFRLLIAAVSAAMIGGAANSINDVFDVEIDRVNRPARVLPAGLLTPTAARGVWAIGSAAGIALSLFLSSAHVVLALGATGLLYLYSARLKRTLLLGNVVVALLSALALIYGGWAVAEPGPAVIGAVFAFLTTAAREIVKDLQDVDGDAVADARTLPLLYGPRWTVWAVSALLGLTIAVTPLPFLLFGYGGLFLLLVFVVDALLLRVLWVLHRPDPAGEAGHASRLLKSAMVVGMGALAFAWISE